MKELSLGNMSRISMPAKLTQRKNTHSGGQSLTTHVEGKNIDGVFWNESNSGANKCVSQRKLNKNKDINTILHLDAVLPYVNMYSLDALSV